MPEHLQLMENAKNAIDEMFQDTSVSRDDTQESLEELNEHIESLLDALVE